MEVSVIGTGYVGLVTGACLADRGHRVVCVDIDAGKVDRINRCVAPIHEQGLEELLKRTVGKRLRADTDLEGAVLDSAMTILAVGTPFDGKQIDLTAVREASRQVGMALARRTSSHVVVVKSTVVPGTTDQLVRSLLEQSSGKKAGVDFGLGMNPEFLTEGQALADFMEPDRIILGADDDLALRSLEELYASFEGVPVLRTNTRTAEMIKYASNAMLATQISFANEIGNLCSTLGGMDVVDVFAGVHLSNYLSPVAGDGKRVRAPVADFLAAGCGFGGSCLPKDVKALVAHGEAEGSKMAVLKAVIETNEYQPRQIVRLLRKHFASLRQVHVAVLGLTFKPDTDDMRQSPAIPIVSSLIAEGAVVKCYDPVAEIAEACRHLPPGVTYCGSLREVLTGAEAAVLVTRWEQFREVPALVKTINPGLLFVDGRRMLDRRLFERYEGIGR